MLVLHIGLPRAGSSAIQYCLAEQAKALSGVGLHYATPAAASWQPNGVSSGNGMALARYLDPRRRPEGFSEADFERGFAAAYLSPGHAISLISSEFCSAASKSKLARFRQEVLGSRPVRVIAVVRDLYDHAFSTWSQMVKDQACARSFRDFAMHAYDNPQCRALNTFGKAFGYENLRVVHYNSCREGLFPAFLQALDVDLPDAEEAPRVNRGLTSAELEVQLTLNRLHRSKRLARSISNRLVGRRPDLPAANLWDQDVADHLASRFGEDVRWINRMVFADSQDLAVVGPRRADGARPSEPRSWIVADAAHAVLTHAASRLMVRPRRDRQAASA